MLDKEYFFGSGKINQESYMLKSEFTNDLISLVKKGYLIDFFGKLPMSDQQLKIMNVFLDNGESFYNTFGRASAKKYGIGVEAKEKIMKAYFSVYAILQNLCLDCNYGDMNCSNDRFITSNIDVVTFLIGSGKLCLSATELDNIKKHLVVDETNVKSGVIHIISFKEVSCGQYRVEMDSLELCKFSNCSEIIIPLHLASLYINVITHILFSSSRAIITYMDGNDVKRINTKLELSIHKDSGFSNHYMNLFDIDCYKTGSSEFVTVDVLSIIDIKIME